MSFDSAVIDLETLSLDPKGVILSLGVCLFSRNEKQTFEELLQNTFYSPTNSLIQMSIGRTISESTLQFWNREAKTPVPEVVKNVLILPDNSDAHDPYYEKVSQFKEVINSNLRDNTFINAMLCTVTPEMLINRLQEYLDKHLSDVEQKELRWYCLGPTFDFHFLQSFCTDFGLRLPYNYRKTRCVRTFLEENGVAPENYPESPKGFIKHRADHDAALCAYRMQHLV